MGYRQILGVFYQPHPLNPPLLAKERGKELEERFHLSLTLLNYPLWKSLLERGLCPGLDLNGDGFK
jgi:hypothetical protein